MAKPSDVIDTGLARLVPLPSGEDLTSFTSDCFIVRQTRDNQLRFSGLGKPKGALLRRVAVVFEEPENLYGLRGTRFSDDFENWGAACLRSLQWCGFSINERNRFLT